MAPAAFDSCVAGGGRVRTMEAGKGKYLHVCYPRGGGPSVAGEEKTKKPSTAAFLEKR